MLDSLRRKFIATSMVLVSIIVIGIIAALLINTYSQQQKSAAKSLTWALNFATASQNGNSSGFDAGKIGGEKPSDGENVRPGNENIIIVYLDKNGDVIKESSPDNITVDDDALKEITEDAYDSDETYGHIHKYELIYMKKTTSSGTVIAYADMSNSQDSFSKTLKVSLVAGIASLIILFFICRFLAKRAVRPVEKAWVAQKQFVADASHELKTPLTVILANTDIVMSHDDSKIKEERKWLESTKAEAQSMTRLVNDMLFLAKADMAKSQAYVFGNVNVSDIADECALNFESVAFEKKVGLSSDISSGISVLGDQAKLRELFTVLIDNAVKYSDADTTVHVSLTSENEHAVFNVKNTGSVIPQDKQAHIFERFYRADESRNRSTGGYGLGLAIAYNIAHDHKGTLVLDHSTDKETSFTVRIPLYPKTKKLT